MLYVLESPRAFFKKIKSRNFRTDNYFSKRFFYLYARTQKLQNSRSILRFDSFVYELFTKIDRFVFGFKKKMMIVFLLNFCKIKIITGKPNPNLKPLP